MVKKQSGQAMVYALLMMTAVLLSAAYIFNSYQVSNEKTRLQNTIDNAAYSVAVIEARDLNFMSYTNRAMVANHVAVAQVVSMLSWIRFLDNTARNLSAVTGWIPYLGTAVQALEQGVNAIKEVFETGANILVPILNGWIRVISVAQQLMHFLNITVAYDSLGRVLNQNDPDVDWAGLNLATWTTYVQQHLLFTQRYSPDRVRDGRRNWRDHKVRADAFRNITLQSRDKFSDKYLYNLIPRITIGPARFEMKRAGGTEFYGPNSRAPYYTWSGMDTLSAYFGVWFFGWHDTEVPIGWGAAQAGERKNLRTHRREDYFTSNSRASNLAVLEFRTAPLIGGNRGYGGLADFNDIKQDGYVETGPGIVLVATKPQDKIRTTGTVNNDATPDGLDLQSESNMLYGRSASWSKATVYYARPKSHLINLGSATDDRREYGNLYNPYWQPKLAALTAADKAIAGISLGVGL
ncbi:pilus assembly protein TadG-related protein [Pelagibaculum spongiae]|uniref:Putative Flp pilus-assembly TadG-like N-terminal domain-containing protein n=1 Tax=Pelagibaculum spongiae TaxID=2080658 RepID=A0A2V1GZI3_9GAMM|nr:pilus assembly protein TadG-related protein [Pelagibaculum spongiae]PVZ68203.1 hypothetical protein DC094_12960 [Pelagibaculum spongiae]